MTNKNIGVAVLDTGIYRHIDFDNRIIAFKDFINNRSIPYDDSGHGTHVSGIIAGSGSTKLVTVHSTPFAKPSDEGLPSDEGFSATSWLYQMDVDRRILVEKDKVM